MEKITLEYLKALFYIETTNSFNCENCKYKKYVVCCPEENDCQVQREWIVWLQNKLIEEMNKNI